MVTTIEKPQILSLEAFLALPETQPASEYANGFITPKAMPKGKHSRIQTRFARTIDQVTEEPKIALALTELRCTFAGRSIVADIAVIRWQNLPLDPDGEISNQFSHAPDWIIEILSPDQSPVLVIEKILFCLSQGSEIGWLLDPATKSVMIFQNGSTQIYFATAENPQPLTVLTGLENLQITAQDIFAWLKV
ncbi:Uma2 family endonuclease [Pseudanabaena sp. FACHB-1998]|uniref:Uma2 family endonuclease n=1 Tax=Pseudanabaena sp. FACHB-1998 TaxID=2692858 RepID=UPI0016804C2C|nr:Uma2 family endonuclease [Pseudanabaena sp. FACHB-1998]MBD2178022.1 Uma2 family endonuclease [Pseudanabaena sp. FACHB-1998]